MAGGRLQVQTGADGCCDGCTVLSDTFTRADDTDLGADWDEQAGSWAIASNDLETTSSSGRCITAASNPAGDYTGISEGTFDATSMSTGDEVKLFVSFLDASNTFYAVFKAADGSGVGGTAKMYNGAGSQQGSTVSLPSFKAGVTSSIFFRLCFNGQTLIVNTPDGDESVDPGTYGYGDQAGVGTGTITGTARVLSYAFKQYQDDANGCDSCTVPCDLLCTGATPGVIKIEWSGLLDSNSECIDCAVADSGTLYLPFLSYYSPAPACNYGYGWLPLSLFDDDIDGGSNEANCYCDAHERFIMDYPPGSSDMLWRAAIIQYDYGTGLRYWLTVTFVAGCEIGGDSDAVIEFRYDLGASKPDCMSLGSPLTLTTYVIDYETGDETDPQQCIWAATGAQVIATILAA
jgi:hypothetical protein